MITKLLIKNIALIDSAEIDFSKGLNVLSGETGSGKSVILESINFVLGGRADKSMIRNGENECFVSIVFDVFNNQHIYNVFKEFDFDIEDQLIISRKFNIDGRSSIKINGKPATVGMIKNFVLGLVDVHGQSEHFYLLKTSNQLQLIDKFAGNELFEIKNILKIKYEEYKNVKKELDVLGGDEAQRQNKIDILSYQIQEIESADLKIGEEQELIKIKDKLLHHEKIVNALSMCYDALSSEGGVLDVFANISKNASNIRGFGEEYTNLSDLIENVYSELDDLSRTAYSLKDNVDDVDYSLDSIEERLDLIKKLKRKYGSTTENVLEFLSNAILEKEKLENFNKFNQELLFKKEEKEKELLKLYNNVTQIRKKYAEIFSKNVLLELNELGMPSAEFRVDFKPIDEVKYNSANGIDEIEFLFSANKGEDVKPLAFVISGGEMSRFMLAIKVQTSKFNDISTFIFDEIDAGISGETAKIVAKKFTKISKNAQIIAISHLPQISAMADTNLLISKVEKDNKTSTLVSTLTEKDKVEEIIRLIGGERSSQSAQTLAKELIEYSNNYKKSL